MRRIIILMFFLLGYLIAIPTLLVESFIGGESILYNFKENWKGFKKESNKKL